MEMSKAAIVICSDDRKLIKVQAGHERFFSERRNKLMLTSTKRLTQKEVNALYEKNIQDYFQEPVNEKVLYSKLEFHLKSLETYFKGLARAEEIRKRREAEEEERKAMMAKRQAEQEAKKAKREAEAKENANKEKPKKKSMLMMDGNSGSESGQIKIQDHISPDQAKKLGEDLISGKIKLVEKSKLQEFENQDYQEKNQKGSLNKDSGNNELESNLKKSKFSSMVLFEEIENNQKISGKLNTENQSENKKESTKKGFMLESSAYSQEDESGKLSKEDQKKFNQLDSQNTGNLKDSEIERIDNNEKGSKLEDQEQNKLKSKDKSKLSFDEENLKSQLQKNFLNTDNEKENNQLKSGLTKGQILFTEDEKIKSHQKGKSETENGEQLNKIEQGKELKNNQESNQIKNNQEGKLSSESKDNINVNQSGKLETFDGDKIGNVNKSNIDASLENEKINHLAKSKLNNTDVDSNKLNNSQTSVLSEEGKKLNTSANPSESSKKLNGKENPISEHQAKTLSNGIKEKGPGELSKAKLDTKIKEQHHQQDVKKSLSGENRDTIKSNEQAKLNDPHIGASIAKDAVAKSSIKDEGIKKEEKSNLEGNQRSLLKRLDISKKKNLDVFEMADLRYKNYDWNKKFENWETEKEKILQGGKKLQELEKLNKTVKKTAIEIEHEKEAKVIQKDIYHGDLKGLEVAIKIMQGINALEQKPEDQTFVFELIGKNIFERFRALTTFYQKDTKQNSFIPIFSIHGQHNTLWEDYYLKDWSTYSEKKINDWKNYKYSQVLEFTPQGKINPESQDSTFEYIFPIDSPKGIIGFAIVHFHQLALTDIETQATELQLELSRGYFYRVFHVLSTAKNSGNPKPKSLANGKDKEDENENSDSIKNPIVDKVMGKIGNLLKWKKQDKAG